MGRTNYFVEELRGLIREHLFDKQIHNLAGDYKRMDEFDSGLDWALARAHEEYFTEVAKDYYIWKTIKTVVFPKLRILFQYKSDLNQIVLVEVAPIS